MKNKVDKNNHAKIGFITFFSFSQVLALLAAIFASFYGYKNDFIMVFLGVATALGISSLIFSILFIVMPKKWGLLSYFIERDKSKMKSLITICFSCFIVFASIMLFFCISEILCCCIFNNSSIETLKGISPIFVLLGLIFFSLPSIVILYFFFNGSKNQN